MNFFDAQDNARRATRWLVIVYIIATILIVAGVSVVVAAVLGRNPSVILAAAAAATALIVGSTLFKTARLSSGGGTVAADMGGTPVPADVQDPLRRRLRNVVEEMAIASGIPVPEIYVLEKESGINAFAAGYSTGDAAIAVTRGTLELLDRDELQGVIAHEFSHILNGDMRLNIRMMGVLFGIMVIGLIGRMILRGFHRTSIISTRRGKNSGGIMSIGVGLVILGWIGVFFARLIKAAVSRQREYLADASAVQFTRQTDGIANALKKIGGYDAHSYIKAADPEEVSHMLFASGTRFASLFATHPPLTDRIRALDPQFDPATYPDVQLRDREMAVGDGADVRTAGLAPVGRAVEIGAGSLAASVGNPGPQHVGFAQKLRQSIPEEIYSAAHSSSQAYLLTLALVVDPTGKAAQHQLDFLDSQLGPDRGRLVRRYHDEIGGMGPQYRLPLLEISFPALKHTPVQHLEYLLDLSRRLIEIDGNVDFYEFCIYRILTRNLEQATDPAARPSRSPASRQAVRESAAQLLSVLADRGHDDPADKVRAFQAGISVFGEWAADAGFAPVAVDAVDAFGRSLDVLQRMNRSGTQSLLEAISITAAHDGRVSIPEAEMIRAVCASLDCPLPPLLAA